MHQNASIEALNKCNLWYANSTLNNKVRFFSQFNFRSKGQRGGNCGYGVGGTFDGMRGRMFQAVRTLCKSPE